MREVEEEAVGSRFPQMSFLTSSIIARVSGPSLSFNSRCTLP